MSSTNNNWVSLESIFLKFSDQLESVIPLFYVSGITYIAESYEFSEFEALRLLHTVEQKNGIRFAPHIHGKLYRALMQSSWLKKKTHIITSDFTRSLSSTRKKQDTEIDATVLSTFSERLNQKSNSMTCSDMGGKNKLSFAAKSIENFDQISTKYKKLEYIDLSTENVNNCIPKQSLCRIKCLSHIKNKRIRTSSLKTYNHLKPKTNQTLKLYSKNCTTNSSTLAKNTLIYKKNVKSISTKHIHLYNSYLKVDGKKINNRNLKQVTFANEDSIFNIHNIYEYQDKSDIKFGKTKKSSIFRGPIVTLNSLPSSSQQPWAQISSHRRDQIIRFANISKYSARAVHLYTEIEVFPSYPNGYKAINELLRSIYTWTCLSGNESAQIDIKNSNIIPLLEELKQANIWRKHQAYNQYLASCLSYGISLIWTSFFLCLTIVNFIIFLNNLPTGDKILETSSFVTEEQFISPEQLNSLISVIEPKYRDMLVKITRSPCITTTLKLLSSATVIIHFINIPCFKLMKKRKAELGLCKLLESNIKHISSLVLQFDVFIGNKPKCNSLQTKVVCNYNKNFRLLPEKYIIALLALHNSYTLARRRFINPSSIGLAEFLSNKSGKIQKREGYWHIEYQNRYRYGSANEVTFCSSNKKKTFIKSNAKNDITNIRLTFPHSSKYHNESFKTHPRISSNDQIVLINNSDTMKYTNNLKISSDDYETRKRIEDKHYNSNWNYNFRTNFESIQNPNWYYDSNRNRVGSANDFLSNYNLPSSCGASHGQIKVFKYISKAACHEYTKNIRNIIKTRNWLKKSKYNLLRPGVINRTIKSIKTNQTATTLYFSNEYLDNFKYKLREYQRGKKSSKQHLLRVVQLRTRNILTKFTIAEFNSILIEYFFIVIAKSSDSQSTLKNCILFDLIDTHHPDKNKLISFAYKQFPPHIAEAWLYLYNYETQVKKKNSKKLAKINSIYNDNLFKSEKNISKIQFNSKSDMLINRLVFNKLKDYIEKSSENHNYIIAIHKDIRKFGLLLFYMIIKLIDCLLDILSFIGIPIILIPKRTPLSNSEVERLKAEIYSWFWFRLRTSLFKRNINNDYNTLSTDRLNTFNNK